MSVDVAESQEMLTRFSDVGLVVRRVALASWPKGTAWGDAASQPTGFTSGLAPLLLYPLRRLSLGNAYALYTYLSILRT